MVDIQEHVTKKLQERGFSELDLMYNKGLIGATIEETKNIIAKSFLNNKEIE